jgi:outer membrane lipoprotein carrier protein
MRIFCGISLFALILWVVSGAGWAGPAAGEEEMGRAELVEKLESRYGGADIKASFYQESTLEAMDITDTATGRVWFKHPGMMRWEYETPDAHAIITDGKRLWIHRPADNQVILGDAASYFGNGKGASFLSDIEELKEMFSIEKVPAGEPGRYRLKLLPRRESLDLARVFLDIEKEGFLVRQVTTVNAYGDTTRITFRDIRFPENIPASKFRFQIPQGADIVQMEQ